MVRKRVEKARQTQRQRFDEGSDHFNSQMGAAEVLKICRLEDSAKSLLQTATNQLNLSARAFHRIVKVSRTIADLDDSDTISVSHLAEALQYRSRGLN